MIMNKNRLCFKEESKMISVVILTCNNEKTIAATLESVKKFSEVIVFDTGSKDQTLEIAKKYPNVQIFRSTFIPFGKLRNLAASYAKNDWILALDSDEIITDPLQEEIKKLVLQDNTIYQIPRHNFYNKKQIKTCGWHPENCLRLYHRMHTSFNSSFVHENIDTLNQKIVSLKSPLHHIPYGTLDDFIKKMTLYANLFAEEHYLKKKSSPLKAILHGAFHFLRSYIFRLGFMQGKEGFIISWYQGMSSFYKYLKLWEMNQNL
jgi:glycosyltransferase involved in cell wall biosynthesis